MRKKKQGNGSLWLIAFTVCAAPAVPTCFLDSPAGFLYAS